MDPRCIEGLCFCLYLPVACSLAFPIPQEVEVAGVSPNKAQALLWKSLGATHPTPQVGKGVFVGLGGSASLCSWGPDRFCVTGSA